MGLQYGIKEVMNLSIVDFSTNKPVLYSDYAELTTNENKMNRLDLRGGQGNFKIMSFDYEKDSTLKVTLPLVDLKMLAILAGQDAVSDANANVFMRDVLQVSSDKVTTTKAVASNSTVSVFKLKGDRDHGKEFVQDSATADGKYTISTLAGVTTITFDSADTNVTNGDFVVVYYMASTPATGATKISINANKFPKAVKIYGDGLWRDSETESDHIVKVTAFKARPKGDFTISMAGTSATKLEMTFDLYGVTNKATGDIQFIDYVILP